MMGEGLSAKHSERVQMQILYQNIEKKTKYSYTDIEHIWQLLKWEMIRCFQEGKSIDLGGGFGYMQTSIFESKRNLESECNSRFQVRFKAGNWLKEKLLLKKK